MGVRFALFITGVALCMLLAVLTVFMIVLRRHDRMIQRSPLFLILQNAGALIYFYVVLLYFAQRVSLSIYVDAIGDLGQCMFVWASIIRCYRLYWVARPTFERPETSRALERGQEEDSDARHSVPYLLRWFALAVFTCMLYNMVWDFVRIIPGVPESTATSVRLWGNVSSGVFYLVVFAICIKYLRNVADYYRQSTELTVLCGVAALTRASIVYHALATSHSLVATTVSLGLLLAALALMIIVSALAPVVQTLREACCVSEPVFPELSRTDERKPLIDARLRSHDVKQVAILRRVDDREPDEWRRSSPPDIASSARQRPATPLD